MHGPDAAVVYAFLVAGLRGQQGVECSEGSEDLFRVLFAAEACGFPSIESSQRTSPFFDLYFQLASILGHESSIRCCRDGGKRKGSQGQMRKADFHLKHPKYGQKDRKSQLQLDSLSTLRYLSMRFVRENICGSVFLTIRQVTGHGRGTGNQSITLPSPVFHLPQSVFQDSI